jgi:hypothetical protein
MTRDNNLQIRLATLDDMDEIMGLAALGVNENGFVYPNMGKLAAEFWPALRQDHGLCGIIGRPGGPIEGGVLLRIGEMWYSDQVVVQEKMIFIHPDYRSAKGGRARKLCEFSKHVADTLGLPLLIGVLNNHRTAGKVRMYQRQFGPPAGAFFLYGAKTGEFSRTEQ